MILRTENGSLEQGTVPCFVMLYSMTNIKINRADHMICSVFMKKRGEYIKNEPFAFA